MPNSRELVRYISKTPKFFQNLNKLLSDKNWLGKFKLCVNDGSGFHEMFYLDCNISNIQNQQILREYINKYPNIVGKNNTEKIENIIKEYDPFRSYSFMCLISNNHFYYIPFQYKTHNIHQVVP